LKIFGLTITKDRATPDGQAGLARQEWQASWTREVPDATDYKFLLLARDTIPAINSALTILTTLVGDVDVTADEPLRSDILAFLDTVRVNHLQTGFGGFQAAMIRQSLLYGKSFGEIVPANAGNDIYALANIDTRSIILEPDASRPYELAVRQLQSDGKKVLLDNFWLLSLLNDPEGNPNGVSLLRSIPFVAKMLIAVEESWGQTWTRWGDPPCHVNVKLPDGTHQSAADERLTRMRSAFGDAMKANKQGFTRDFFTTGDVTIDTIGAQHTILPFVDSMRALEEQVVSATHLPPWMLGFSWSTTERLSTQQADLLTSMIRGIQSAWKPQVVRLLTLWCEMTGRKPEFEVSFASISLQDAAETAKAQVLEAQGLASRESTARKLWQTGVYTQEQYAAHTLGEDWDGEIAQEMTEPPSIAADAIQPAVQSGTFSSSHRCHHFGQGSHAGGGEQPRDKHVAAAIKGFRADIDASWAQVRAEAWKALGLAEVKMTAAEPEPFSPTKKQLALLDNALGRFLTDMAGAERTREAFVSSSSADGLIQQWDRFAYAVGLNGAQRLTKAEASVLTPGRDAAAVQHMLGEAFDRLSENGQMRLERIIPDIHEMLADAAANNMNPLDVAAELSARFDHYSDFEFERLARTEVAFAQNAALVDEFAAEGFANNLNEEPPFHPNCLCSLTIDTERREVVYDIATEACDLCQAYISS